MDIPGVQVSKLSRSRQGIYYAAPLAPTPGLSNIFHCPFYAHRTANCLLYLIVQHLQPLSEQYYAPLTKDLAPASLGTAPPKKNLYPEQLAKRPRQIQVGKQFRIRKLEESLTERIRWMRHH